MNAINTHMTPNSVTLDDLKKVAADLGADRGKGKDTQVKFLLKMVDGGYHNAIDLEKDKHGADKDDATVLAEIYVKAQGSAAVFDAKADNQRKLISCLRTCIKLGQWPKGGTGEPLATVNNLMSIRQKLRANPAEAKKLDDAANTLLSYARTQLKRDQLVDDDELKGFCYKKQSALQTPEDIIENARKSLMRLRDGKAASNTACDNSKHVIDAINSLTKRLKEIAEKRSGVRMGIAALNTNTSTQAATQPHPTVV